MLSSLFALALAGAGVSPPDVGASRDVAELSGILPGEVVQTVEWTCANNSSVAQIRTAGVRPTTKGMGRFNIELTKLQVAGHSPSVDTERAVKDALNSMWTVGKFIGRCADPRVPKLIIGGHYYDGQRWHARAVAIELR